MKNLLTSIQMQLSSKLKTFLDIFFPFLESALNFEDIENKYDRQTNFISEYIDC